MNIFAEVQLWDWNSENTCRIYACLSVVKTNLCPSSLKEPVLPQPSLHTPGRNPGIYLALGVYVFISFLGDTEWGKKSF